MATVAASAASLAASPALASTEHYCTGPIRANYACGGNSHNGIYYVEVITDHTACAGFAVITGYYGVALGGFTDKACTSGAGSAGTGFAASNGIGGVRNPSVSTQDNISDAHASY